MTYPLYLVVHLCWPGSLDPQCSFSSCSVSCVCLFSVVSCVCPKSFLGVSSTWAFSVSVRYLQNPRFCLIWCSHSYQLFPSMRRLQSPGLVLIFCNCCPTLSQILFPTQSPCLAWPTSSRCSASSAGCWLGWVGEGPISADRVLRLGSWTSTMSVDESHKNDQHTGQGLFNMIGIGLREADSSYPGPVLH